MHARAPNLLSIWWLHPGKLLLFFILPLYFFVAWIVPMFWPNLVIVRYGTYLNTRFAIIGAACIFIAGVSALIGSRLELSERTPSTPYMVNERFMIGIGLITVAAYLLWFGPAILRGEIFLSRNELNRTPGVTSFTQLGVVFVVCYAYATLKSRQQLSIWVRMLFYGILVMTMARVFIWKERLAFIEVGIPGFVCLLAYAQPRRPLVRAGFKLIGMGGPLLGIPVLLGFFTITEFFRSWSSDYYQSQNKELGEFMVSRLATYYYTSLNNGAGLLATTDWPDFTLIHVLSWFYKLPFGIGEMFVSTLGSDARSVMAYLARFGDLEFTNMSGIFPIVHDIGVWCGLVYFGLFGLLGGLMYRGMQKGRPIAIMLFPVMIVAYMEIMRIAYLNISRSFVIIVGALIATTQLRPTTELFSGSWKARALA